MLTYKPIQSLLLTALWCLVVTLAAARAGAPPDTFKQSEQLRKRAAKTSEDIHKFVARLDRTERALSVVGQARPKDLKKRYESFSKEASKLEEAQKEATSDIDKMRSKDATYFSSWDRSIAQMSDPELQRVSRDQRSKVMQDHEELAATLSQIAPQLQPFMSNLRDLKALLGAELSTENVDKASGMIQKSRNDAQALKAQIEGVQSTLKLFLAEAPQ